MERRIIAVAAVVLVSSIAFIFLLDDQGYISILPRPHIVITNVSTSQSRDGGRCYVEFRLNNLDTSAAYADVSLFSQGKVVDSNRYVVKPDETKYASLSGSIWPCNRENIDLKIRTGR